MRKWARTTGLLFCAAASVYNGPVAFAAQGDPANVADPSTKVKLLDGNDSAVASETGSGAHIAGADNGTFSLQINGNIDVVQVLRMLANQAQVSIIPSKGVRGTIPAMDLYNVTVPEALDAILQPNGMVWVKRGNLIFVYTQQELEDQEKATRRKVTQVFTLHYVPASDALTMIRPALSADATAVATKDAQSGIDTGGSDSSASGSSGSSSGSSVATGGNSESGQDLIVVNDYPDVLARVASIIEQLDRRPQQILVEATILEANLNENNALGIDFSLMGGVNFDTILSNNTSVSTALSGNILNPTSGSGSGGTTSGNGAPLVAQGYSGFTTGNYDTQVPAGGLQIGIVRNNLAVFISALESVATTTVLANPKVLVLNKQAGEVQVGQQLGYQTTTVTQTTSTQTVQFLDTGTILSFRPFIGDDGYIRMEIHPEDSTGTVTNNLPDKTTTEVTSNIMVKDGNTIVIGGMFKDNSSSGQSQVPFFGSLPIVGALFRSKQDSTQRQEVIILLTPHIIKDDAAYSKLSEQEEKEIEKMRVGVRKGMMWFGRERLAETAYENAQAVLAHKHPDIQLALWYLNCATNLNPLFLEAIELKEKLTGHVVTDVDNSSIRYFLRKEIMAEHANAATQPSSSADIAEPLPGESAATRPAEASRPVTEQPGVASDK